MTPNTLTERLKRETHKIKKKSIENEIDLGNYKRKAFSMYFIYPYSICPVSHYVTPKSSTFPLNYMETFSKREIVLRRVKNENLISLVRFFLGVVINGLKKTELVCNEMQYRTVTLNSVNPRFQTFNYSFFTSLLLVYEKGRSHFTHKL